MSSIEIIVRGKPKCGKTTLVANIAAVLRHMGLSSDIEIKDSDLGDSPLLMDDLVKVVQLKGAKEEYIPPKIKNYIYHLSEDRLRSVVNNNKISIRSEQCQRQN